MAQYFKAKVSWVVLLAVSLFPPLMAVAADNPRVNVNLFRPSPHPGDLLGIYTANEPEHLDWGVGAWLYYNHRPLRFVNDGSEIVSYQGVAEIYGTLGLFDFLDVGLSIPLVMAGGDDPFDALRGNRWPSQVSGFSLGDIRLGIKGTILGGNGKGFGLAIAEDLSFPTATGHNFAGDELVTSTTNVVLDFSMKGWQAAINLGVRARKEVQLFGNTADHQLLIGAGVSVPIICGFLEGVGTLESRTSLLAPFASTYDNAQDLMGGLRLNWNGLTLLAAAGGGALEEYGSPAWRVAVNVGYQSAPQEKGCIKDSDTDGIPDPDDACPTEPGPNATLGCPDRDGDGIQDAEDQCPDAAGPKDLGGCPDRDKDGVPDKTDACPDTAGLSKFNGCPDTDKDGIPDNTDACPTEAGPARAKGCPDQDGDGILDKDDKCPDVYGKKEFQGCPPPTPKTVRVTKEKIEILQQVFFETNKAIIRPESFQILNDVAQVLKDNPNLRVRVEGHTDNVGNDRKNLVLSQKRAEAVRDYLVKQGVAPDRLVPQGYGETRPIADNKTKGGRAKNRRVEFVIIGNAPNN